MPYACGCGRWSDHFPCWELLLAEIVEPILTPEQRDGLEQTKSVPGDHLLWAGEALIRSTGYDKTRHSAKVDTSSAPLFRAKAGDGNAGAVDTSRKDVPL